MINSSARKDVVLGEWTIVVNEEGLIFGVELWQARNRVLEVRSRNIFFLINKILEKINLVDGQNKDLILNLMYRFFGLEYMSDLIYAQRRGSISSYVNTLDLNEEENKILNIVLDYCK